mmetsp:Transcript_5728/g.14958  ORF Transcript_5728/g.14958 Transcript_5728/m.14958 type:complete len:303 (-) Transcript_5728:203-1111(-)
MDSIQSNVPRCRGLRRTAHFAEGRFEPPPPPRPPVGCGRDCSLSMTENSNSCPTRSSPSPRSSSGSSEKWKKNCSDESGVLMNPNESLIVAAAPCSRGSVDSRKAIWHARRRREIRSNPTLSSTMSPAYSPGESGTMSFAANERTSVPSPPSCTCTRPVCASASLRPRLGATMMLPTTRPGSTSTDRSSSAATTTIWTAAVLPVRGSSRSPKSTASPCCSGSGPSTSEKWKKTRPKSPPWMKPKFSLMLATVPSCFCSGGSSGSARPRPTPRPRPSPRPCPSPPLRPPLRPPPLYCCCNGRT